MAASTRPATVLMVANQFPKFSETFIVEKFLRLRDRGWNIHLACRSSDPGQWAHYPELRSQAGVAERVHVTSHVADVVESVRPDLVHFEFGTLAIRHIEAARRSGARILVSFRGSDLSTYGLDDPECYREVWESADALHLLSSDLWRLARRRGCPAGMPHVLIPPAVRLDAWQRGRRRRDVDVAGTPDRPLRIVSVGRLAWVKGYAHALAAVRRLQDQGVNCEYRILGDGPERAGVLFDVHDFGLEERVGLLGAVAPAEVRSSLRWADVFLHAALYEGFCNSVLEAQSMGLPVVCTDAGALPENVRDAVTGFVVPRRDPAAIADRLTTLAGDPALRRRMGRAGRRRVRRSFRAEDQIRRFEELYADLLSRAPAAAGLAGEVQPAARAPRGESESRRRLGQAPRDVGGGPSALDAIRNIVQREFPSCASFLVVSRGDDRLLDLGGRPAGHFPQTEDGTYSGYHPVDGADAVRQLERLRARGCDYLLFPWTSSWWLEHYRELRDHLEVSASRVHFQQGVCIVYALHSESPARPNSLIGAGHSAEGSDGRPLLALQEAG